ncbi:MAG: DUF503 domain-containing protein [Synergistaceae bacterium]|jgi:uncharacterized protein YlxP (DUF503 family)|nr:DUF503 domain-containing protein [Synergistaceae bacterium]
MKPWVGVAIVSIKILGSSSLKDRRQVVRSLTERARFRCGVSAADLGPDAWDRADLAFSAIGSSHQEMEARMNQLLFMIEKNEDGGDFEVLGVSQEVFSYGDIQDRATE